VNAIEVQGLTKRYRQYRDEASILMRVVAPHRRRSREVITALDEISFTASPGETLGIIGRNGSGKTTLLQLLAGVSAPTAGRLRVVGRVAPLIGVGVGFNRELTGRENVYVNGRLLGMGTDEIREKFDAIADFSEIEEFLDTPVKFYSTGMFLRLAFSIAIHTTPDIFVLDELLAVGDIGFQLKCNERIRQIQQSGATVVVVTHNLQTVQRLAARAILLDKGRIVHDGKVEDAISAYHHLLHSHKRESRSAGAVIRDFGRSTPLRSADVAAVDIRLLDDQGGPTYHLLGDRPSRVEIRATFAEPVTDPLVGLSIERAGAGLLHAVLSAPGALTGTFGPDRPLTAVVEIGPRLLAGTFAARGVVQTRDADTMLGNSEPLLFEVSTSGRGFGFADLGLELLVDGHSLALIEYDRLEDGSRTEPARLTD